MVQIMFFAVPANPASIARSKGRVRTIRTSFIALKAAFGRRLAVLRIPLTFLRRFSTLPPSSINPNVVHRDEVGDHTFPPPISIYFSGEGRERRFVGWSTKENKGFGCIQKVCFVCPNMYVMTPGLAGAQTSRPWFRL